MITRFLLLMMVVVASAGKAVAQEPKRRCTVELPRNLPRTVAPALRDCDVDRVARLRSDGRVSYTPPQGMRSDWVCEKVVMVFIVDTTGSPDPRSVRIEATTRPEWAVAVLAALPNIRFRPAEAAGRPVRQVVRYTRSALIPKLSVLSGSRLPTASERWKAC